MPEQMQHETRQNYTFHDQHGRPWLAIVDTRTKPYLAPCVQPWPQFDAPILPFGTLLVPNAHQLGRLDINYAKWEEDATAQERTYLDTLQSIAERMFGDKAARAIAERDPALMAAVGPAPASPLFVRAAAAGNKWVLGLVPADKVPAWAQPVLDTLPQFRPQLTTVSAGMDEFPDVDDDETEASEDALPVDGMFSDDAAPVTRGRGRPRKVAA